MSRYGLVPFSYPFAHYWREPRDIWDESRIRFPSRIFDQRFGLGLSEQDILPQTSFYDGLYVRPRRQFSRQQSGLSEIKSEGDKFQVMLDVNQFSPDELTVKTVDNTIVVHGKHQEKVDEHGFISREFTRRYVLPEGVRVESVVSSLSADGVLTVEAPRRAIEAPKSNERLVPILCKEPTQETPAVAGLPASD